MLSDLLGVVLGSSSRDLAAPLHQTTVTLAHSADLPSVPLYSFSFVPVNRTWSSLLPFFKKAEHFYSPNPSPANATVVYDASSHGVAGPVSDSYPPFLSPQFAGFYDSLLSKGVNVAKDLSSGDNRGVSYTQSTMQPDSRFRATAESYRECHLLSLDIPPKHAVCAAADEMAWVAQSPAVSAPTSLSPHPSGPRRSPGLPPPFLATRWQPASRS